MIRRNLLRALMATPLAGRVRQWIPPTFGGAEFQERNAARIYRRVFGWAECLRAEDRSGFATPRLAHR